VDAARPALVRRAERPIVTVHYAQTLDGRIATRSGQAQWISSEATLQFAHQLRAAHDAVMVGVGTVIADDPRLTVRLVPGRSPYRIVVDSRLRLPPGSQVLTDGAAPTILATTAAAPADRREALRAAGIDLLVARATADGQVDLADLLVRLPSLGLASVLLEGGRGLLTSVLRGRLVDRWIVCIAPKLIGQGVEAVGDLGITHLSQAITFAQTSIRVLGPDLIFDGTLAAADAASRRAARLASDPGGVTSPPAPSPAVERRQRNGPPGARTGDFPCPGGEGPTVALPDSSSGAGPG
jgi:riboflavin-specific deaminase-like protein